ncbi:MAG: hypothetical protein F6K58_00630 [Symploca sp. SIO2E9]|nr:hypothetical protein [Symploca sp. SIO2E9]
MYNSGGGAAFGECASPGETPGVYVARLVALKRESPAANTDKGEAGKKVSTSELIDYHFEQIIIQPTNLIKEKIIINTSNSIPEQHSQKDVPVKEDKKFRVSSYLIFLFSYLIPVSIFLLFYGITARIWNSNHPPIFTSKPIKYVVQNKPYKYDITALDIDKDDQLTIEEVSCPSWLTFKSKKLLCTNVLK